MPSLPAARAREVAAPSASSVRERPVVGAPERGAASNEGRDATSWFADVGRRLWNLPLAAHVVALLVVLAVAAWAVGTPGGFSVDEGLAIIQARHLAGGHGWSLPLAFPHLDPGGVTFGFGGATADHVIYAKHPLYPLILAVAQRVGGIWAMLAFSALGTVAAAWLAARLSRHLDTGLDRWVFWSVGLGGPLFIDGLTIFAHSIAAACATLAVLVGVEYQVASRRSWWLIAVCFAVFPAVMLRTESILLLGAWAVALGGWAVWRRQRRAVAVAIVTALAVVAARLVDRAWAQAVGGSGVSLADAGGTANGHGLAAGIGAAPSTLLGTSLSSPGSTGSILLLLAFSAAVFGAWTARTGERGTALALPWFVAVGCLIGALAVGRPVAVPGLFIVCPLFTVAVVVASRDIWHHTPHGVVAATVVVFFCAVLLTEYGAGGSIEWGARYLAVGVPLATAIAVGAVASRSRALGRASHRTLVTGLVVASLLLSWVGVSMLRRDDLVTNQANGFIESRARATPPGDGGLPVVMTTDQYLVRLGWPLDRKVRWMVVKPGQEQHWADQLRAHGIGSFVLIRDAGGGMRLTVQHTDVPVARGLAPG